MSKHFLTKSDIKYGARLNKETNNIDFRLYSATALDVTLCVFRNPLGDIPFFETPMEKDGSLFKVSVPKDKILGRNKVFYYGYRVFGENFVKVAGYKPGSDIGFISKLDMKGNRFNPNKLAYDPYSFELSHMHSGVSGDMTPFRSGGENYLSDNSKIAPKSVFAEIKESKITSQPVRAFKDEIIAEVHLKDLTRLLKISDAGTYKAAAKFARTIKKTGVTTVEFLPLTEFDSHFEYGNHWGYMPLNYFALKKSYSKNKTPFSALYDFRKVIDAFHKEGLKVCLDVVYNHTGEAKTFGDNEDALLFSYALIDNKNYYKLAQNSHYTNHSGCGNDVNTITEASKDLIIESLSFWINQGVDAFRFDLAVALMDTSSSGYAVYDKNGGILKDLKKKLHDKGHKINPTNAASEGVSLIAEPWMCAGACNYQLGNFPSYFSEWNDIARDTIRKISIAPNEITPRNMRNVIEGTPQKFLGTSRSINYVASHDGFTLFDLNNFNMPNPNTKCGFRGELCSNYDNNIEEQDNAIRKQILILMISKGIPMIQFGDIFLHSKNGNNNSYNLDNATNRINYKLDKRKENLSRYIKALIKFRRENPVFSETYLTERIEYLYPSGATIREEADSYWKNTNSNILCFKIKDVKTSYYIAISKDINPIELTLPKEAKWYLTADTKKDFINLKGIFYNQEKYTLLPYSACIFKEGKKLWK